ncbi:hypothetical protein DKP78_19960, partial [Enterococcus faecium]
WDNVQDISEFISCLSACKNKITNNSSSDQFPVRLLENRFLFVFWLMNSIREQRGLVSLEMTVILILLHLFILFLLR